MSPRALRLLLALALGALPATVPAQPAMPDPAMMSGIPRPDPQVPAGTITVRLIRGELSNRLTGVDVELVPLPAPDKDRPARTEKSDAEGRATFSGLAPGAYEARAVVDDEALASQPIELAAQPGVRVMLVFSKSVADQQQELGKADGKARVSLQLPPGTLVIRAVDEKGGPLKDARVSLSHGDRATEKVDTLPEQKADDKGEARFTDLKFGTGDGYLASVVRDGTTCRGKPFRLIANHGSLIAIECRPASRDASQIKIGGSSHIILELEDDMLQGVENLRLSNPLEQPVDPGPAGIRIPLPEGALSAQAVPVQEGQTPPVVIDVSRAGEAPVALWKGPVPPGETDVRVAFMLKHRGTLRFHQATPVGFESVRVIVEKSPEMKVEGAGYESEERKWQGRDLLLISAKGTTAGGVIDFTVSGLPYQAPIGRYLAALVALSVALGFGLVARRPPPQAQAAAGRRAELDRRRRELLDRLARSADATPAGEKNGQPDASKDKGDGRDGKKRRRPERAELVEELEAVYREIDELSGSA